MKSVFLDFIFIKPNINLEHCHSVSEALSLSKIRICRVITKVGKEARIVFKFKLGKKEARTGGFLGSRKGRGSMDCRYVRLKIYPESI